MGDWGRRKTIKKIQPTNDKTYPTPKIPFGTAVWVKLWILSKIISEGENGLSKQT